MADKPKPQFGKGSNARPFADYSEYVENFDEIPNFGYKPKWMKELEKPEEKEEKD